MAEDSSNPLASSMALSCAESRRSPRFEADCFIAIQLSHRRVIATCVDYNEHGFGALVEDEQLPVGAILAVELPMAGGVPLKLQARVVYHDGPRHGFEFVAPEESKRRLIADFFPRERRHAAQNGRLPFHLRPPHPRWSLHLLRLAA